ncbi:hypothetical protein CBR_g31124 [Chara braunii]|uniref:Lon proteolytic domain-containing protein n=1 Tax=Chara braunii TaxID=69332 RepID=A0A388LED6_CHABU|nr:hypothetical protein CBR_g31124 [Chara braunii]|eukprot:GBG80664.1 hypothetical protein CBR_g31124 [Chara braunii]
MGEVPPLPTLQPPVPPPDPAPPDLDEDTPLDLVRRRKLRHLMEMGQDTGPLSQEAMLLLPVRKKNGKWEVGLTPVDNGKMKGVTLQDYKWQILSSLDYNAADDNNNSPKYEQISDNAARFKHQDDEDEAWMRCRGVDDVAQRSAALSMMWHNGGDEEELLAPIPRAGVNNPVMLLDEIDKTGVDARGDPAAALLEVLDPEQNRAFNDHYLGVPFDLSKVVFVATANRSSPIPPALRDRMEMIEIPGYTPEEKRRIAMQHLIPRSLEQHGISPWQLQIPEETVEILISRYTREAGVRNLDRHLAALCRAEAVRVAEARTRMQQMEKDIQPSTAALMQGVVGGVGGGGDMELEVDAAAMASGLQGKNAAATVSICIEPIVVDEALLEIVLGPPKFDGTEAAERVSTPGVAVGLVWTAVGGEVQFVEASTMSGKGELQLTGQLGDVIKESAQIALTWVRARVVELSLMVGAGDNLMDGRDVHIHFPAGAVPKDGPSAGVTLITALVSLLSKRSARADTAMTGEVTLRGLVLPVGGVKEKVLAAHRYGIKRVILPHRNVKDLQDVPAEIVAQMEVLPVKNVEEALHHAFEGGCPVLPRSKL